MEDWLKEIKKEAKFEAEVFIEEMKTVAETNDVDVVWFLEEVVKNINQIKNEKFR